MLVSGFSWLAEKIKIINEQGIRIIVVKVVIVEIFCFIKFGKNLMYVTTIGLVAILAPVFFGEELMHPIFVVREFMIQFYAPAI